MDSQGLDLALTRITHQILERNRDLDQIGIVGIHTRGVYLARRIANKINTIGNKNLEIGILDATLYRDDYRISIKQPNVRITDIPFDINGKNVILVDDVLFTGRTVRASLDELMDFGRPNNIQLAIIIDRGNRELPIHPDYVGKTITTTLDEAVSLKVHEIDNEDSIWLIEKDNEKGG